MKSASCSIGRRVWNVGTITAALVVATMVLLTVGCSDGPSTDSETHWMQTCSEDADCGDELSCICEICTASCDGDCSQIAADATCEEAPESCDTAGEPVCLPECDDNTDCQGTKSCDDGVCVGDELDVEELDDSECDADSAFYCEGEDCCPGDCYSITDIWGSTHLLDMENKCLLAEELHAHYCMSPDVVDEVALGEGAEEEACYEDVERGLAFYMPVLSPEVTHGEDSPLAQCSETTRQWVLNDHHDASVCDESHVLQPESEHRVCNSHDECVPIYADCTMSCVCTAVHADYEDEYPEDTLPCSFEGECDYECMDLFSEASRCVEGECTQVLVSYDEEQLVDRVAIDEEYTIGVPAYIDESGGLEETNDGTRFELETLTNHYGGEFRLYYDEDTEFETFETLPGDHLYEDAMDFDSSSSLQGRFFYEAGVDEAVVVVGEGNAYRELMFVEGDEFSWSRVLRSLRDVLGTIEPMEQ